MTTTKQDLKADQGRLVDLIKREFGPGVREINAAWVGDITYIPTWEGTLYLATVIDLESRRVVGYSMADHLRTELVADALEHGLRDPPAPTARGHLPRRQGLPVHQRRLRRPRSGARCPLVVQPHRPVLDNSVAESFFATLKDELIYRRPWPTRRAARAAIFEFIEIFYNRQRLHSALGYLSPADYETIRHTPPPRRHDHHNQPVRKAGQPQTVLTEGCDAHEAFGRAANGAPLKGRTERHATDGDPSTGTPFTCVHLALGPPPERSSASSQKAQPPGSPMLMESHTGEGPLGHVGSSPAMSARSTGSSPSIGGSPP